MSNCVVTVYCSARGSLAPVYYEAGAALGSAIASRGWTLVYGGNSVGVMRAVADAARAAGGYVVGITPHLMVDQGIADHKADELVVTENMRDRKGLLEQRGDAFIVLPGGLGTYEELFEVLVGRQLGYHVKPIVLLNANGYFAPLLALIEHGIAQGFIKSAARDLYYVAETVDDALAHIGSAAAGQLPPAPPGRPATSSAIE